MNLIPQIIKIVIQLAAGIGIGAVMDKVAADKLPEYPKEGIVPKTADGKIHIPKVAYLIGALAIGGFLWTKFSRKIRF